MSFHHKPESIHYNVCLAITGAIRGTSNENPYHELGLESLQLRRWYRKLGMLQETLITFPVLKSDTTSLKTLSFLLQSLNETI